MENPALKGIALTLFLALQTAASAANVQFSVTHCSPLNGPTGIIEFNIDSTYTKGPFFVRLDGPGGFVDTMPAFEGFYHTYTGLKPGRYWISIRCCSTCEARGFLDVKSYEARWMNGAYVLWAREIPSPEVDSTAILMACTEIVEEAGQLCQVSISLYAPEEIAPEAFRAMLEQMLIQVRKRQTNSYEEWPSDEYDVQMPGPYQVLIRFDKKGGACWVHFQPDW